MFHETLDQCFLLRLADCGIYIHFPECFVRDCNGNGTADAEDISSGSSEDTNGNGMPDECEDCNGNGTLDPLDLLDGTSSDVNLNGIPDKSLSPRKPEGTGSSA